MNKNVRTQTTGEYILIIIFFLLCIYALVDKISGAGDHNEFVTQKNNLSSLSAVSEKNEDSDLAGIKKDVENLYRSLLEFKDKNDFHDYGFGIEYKYNQWLKDIELIENESRQKELFFSDFSVGDLKMLGLEYIKTKGKENEYTKWVRSRLDKGLQ